MKRNKSLRWRITWGLVAFQIIAVLIVSGILTSIYFNASFHGVVPDPGLVEAIAKSIGRDDKGALALYPDSSLAEKQKTSPDIWFIAQSGAGERLRSGPVPAIADNVMDVAQRLKSVDIRSQDLDPELTSRFDTITTPTGRYSIIAGGAYIPDIQAAFWLSSLVVAWPTLLLIALTLIAIPPFIRLSLRSTKTLAAAMKRIDFQTRGARLPDDDVPREILPVVQGMNEALKRIDAGFEVTERFFMNAAHELRTPIAILQVRLDALAPGPEQEKLKSVVRRLTTIVHQLLDIERFRQNPVQFKLVDLSKIASQAVADIAPYAVAEGYSISLEGAERPIWLSGNAESLDRMIVNLIQNAVQHAGKRGEIVVHLDPAGTITVTDEGPGVPWESRDRIFEPFFRVNPHGSGAGLGLKMVRDIARSHFGDVALAPPDPVGSTFVVTLPVKSQREVHDGMRDGRFLAPGTN
ncbi:MAG TPA: HAMP domain-containing sensor histidine kinase [Devosia sp.]|nr:HAMP domain-containing sensor histidine kinase [Devosia sp.]